MANFHPPGQILPEQVILPPDTRKNGQQPQQEYESFHVSQSKYRERFPSTVFDSSEASNRLVETACSLIAL
jgi:hypothetical protein